MTEENTTTTERTPYAKLVAERDRYRRRAWHLTAGNEWLKKAGEVFERVTVRGAYALDAIGTIRRHFLPEKYHGLPLCAIERCMFRQGIGALVVFLVYELVKPAIVAQLDAMALEIAADPTTAARYGRAATLIDGTPSCWPGVAAGRRPM